MLVSIHGRFQRITERVTMLGYNFMTREQHACQDACDLNPLSYALLLCGRNMRRQVWNRGGGERVGESRTNVVDGAQMTS